jgi:hypothetical protein
MECTITVSEHVYAALQRQAERSRQSLDTLAEKWLRQHLDLERDPELEWRQGPGLPDQPRVIQEAHAKYAHDVDETDSRGIPTLA